MTKTTATMSSTVSSDDTPSSEEAIRLTADEIREKLGSLKRLYIPHPEANRVLEALERLRQYGNLGDGLGGPARCVLLSGPSGSGKSALLRRWMSKFPAQQTPIGDRQEILYVEVPARCTTKNLAENMLRALNLPESLAGKGTEVALMERVKHHLRHQEVKVIILDEVQHLIDSGSRNVIFRASEFVKSLLNAAICPVVLAGMPEATAIFSENEQLKRRAFGQYALNAFNWEDSGQRNVFRAVLAAYEEQLPLAVPSNLGRDKSLAFRLHCFSGGKVGRAIDFLYAATINALETSASNLSMEVLYDTAAYFPGVNDYGRVNPFGDIDLEALQSQPSEEDGVPSRKTRLRKGKRQLKQSDVLAA